MTTETKEKQIKFVWNVVVKGYHSWNHRSGPDDVCVNTYSYATEKLANDSLENHMLDSIIELIIHNDWEPTYPDNPDFNEKYSKWWAAFVKRLYVSNKNDEDTMAVMKEWMIEHNVVVKDLYIDFMKRCEYAPRREDMSIQKVIFIDE